MESLLVDCVRRNIGEFMFRNAIFICERLCAEFPSEVNLQLLAGCYLHNNQAHCAYHILKGTKMAQSRYLFALSCFQMDLLNEAESALFSVDNTVPETNVPNGAPGHYLLGLVYRYTDRRENAIRQFKKALSIDPLLWAAYEELCVLGHTEEVGEFFCEAAALCIQKQQLSRGFVYHQLRTSMESSSSVSTQNFGAVDTSPRHMKQVHASNPKEFSRDSHGIINGGSSSVNTFYTTPSPVVTRLSAVNPPPLIRNMQAHPVSTESDCPPRMNSTTQAPRRKFVDEGKLRKISGRLFYDSSLRRSSRLAGESASSTSVNSLTGNGNTHSSKCPGNTKLNSISLRPVSVRKAHSWTSDSIDEGTPLDDDSRRSNSVTNPCSSPHSNSEHSEQGPDLPMDGLSISGHSKSSTAICDVLRLFRNLGEAYRHSCMYRSQEALDAYMNLSPKQYNTAWVLSQVGKAYFELVNYFEAERAFGLARMASPCSMEGMDIYSTVLYHLKEDMKLSYLSQELISTDRLAPQTWCAAGNCYSLRKDHETALKIFVRAVNLNSRFTYAHTLCGHEYVAMEDYENGIRCYRSALQTDARHYNAWYGLGMIYLRREKFDFAEHHFRAACRINPSSSVILSYLGTALHSLKRSAEALKVMDRAIKADKKNPLPMFQKASIFAAVGRDEDALAVLEELKECAPRESSVYALMGKIYKRRNLHDKAMLHLGIALDLKPPVADLSKIKAMMESLNVPVPGYEEDELE